jgi:hypothetical protein
MCKPYSIWFLSPGREWHDGLTYGTLGQEVCLLLTSFYNHLSVFCGIVLAYSICFLSPSREWHDGLTYGTLGQTGGMPASYLTTQ